SELASNTAAAALLLPLMMPLAPALGVGTGEMAAFIALGASCGFMLPVATPPNAIVFGSGLVTQREMMRAGVWLDVVCIVVLVGLFSL
ncbi:MAG: anion permease, partial [Myxococcota bacterium]